jgi:hypothetical protein
MNILQPIFVSTFTTDTYSCIKGKGIHAALRGVTTTLKDVQNTTYCLKLDVKMELCAKLKRKFMLTMYPNAAIEAVAKKNKWTIHRVSRQISACKAESRRKQEEWMVTNY